jgi:hypothetical protein
MRIVHCQCIGERVGPPWAEAFIYYVVSIMSHLMSLSLSTPLIKLNRGTGEVNGYALDESPI